MLKETTLSISDISNLVGLQDFFKAFNKMIDTSPSDYRKADISKESKRIDYQSFPKKEPNYMTQKIGIVLVGLNGAGKSTFGKYAATKLGFDFFEVEDYWFKVKHDYQNPRKADEASLLLLRDIQKSEKGFIIGGNISSLSNELLQDVSLISYVDVEKNVRVARVIQRDLDIYGELLPTDPLYHERQSFLNFVKARTSTSLLKWIEKVKIPSIVIDGTLPLEKNLQIVKLEIDLTVERISTSPFINSFCE